MNNQSAIHFQIDGSLDLDEVINLYNKSTLGERRPVEDRSCMDEMLQRANLIVTAWQERQLIGIARTLTDFCYVAYLADLAVRVSHQRTGVGRQLIARTRAQLKPGATIVLLAAPAARDYYPHIGFQPHDSCWVLRADDTLG